MRLLVLVAILGIARLADAKCHDAPADCAFEEGTELLKTDPAGAALRFHASYKLEPAVATLAMYARALDKARDYARAVEAWERVVTQLQADLEAARTRLTAADAAQRASAEDAIVRIRAELDGARLQLAQLGGRVGRITLRFPAGAAQPVIITRKREGENIVSSVDNIPVNAGGETLRITYPDARTQEIEILVSAGNIEVVPVPEVGADVSDDTPDETEPPVRVRRWVGVGVASAGAVALGASLVFALQSRSARRDADANCGTDGICNPVGAAASHRADDRRLYSVVSAVGGVVLVATGAVLWWTDREPRGAHTPAVHASLTASDVTCWVDVSF